VKKQARAVGRSILQCRPFRLPLCLSPTVLGPQCFEDFFDMVGVLSAESSESLDLFDVL
jgi:hypothetical protein